MPLRVNQPPRELRPSAALALLDHVHRVVGQDDIKPGDRNAVDEEAGDGFLEIPPVERHLHRKLRAEAQRERTPHAVDRDGGGENAKHDVRTTLGFEMPDRLRAVFMISGQRRPRWTATMTRTQ